MKAIVLRSFGTSDELEYREIPVPTINNNEVLVKVSATGLNPVDVKTRKGKGQAAKLKDTDPMILGWDISGTIVETGKLITDLKKGDEVFGMINVPGAGKAYAEYVAAPAEHIALKPSNISHEEAAAAGIAAMTAWQALMHQARLRYGQKILIHAAAGGVGHYAIQLAKHLGAHVVATSSAANRDFVMSLGTDDHIDYKATPFEDSAPPVDVILDAIGGENIDRSLKVLKKGGVIVSLPSGISEKVTEKAAAQNKTGIFFFVRSNGKDIQQIAALLATGAIRSHVSKVYPFHEIKAAHDHLESAKTVGKIILQAP